MVVNTFQHALRQVEGKIDVVKWTRGVFDRSATYAASLPSGVAEARDCIVVQVRDISGALEQWELDRGVVKTYSRWQHSTEEGGAEAVDFVVHIEREGEKVVKRVFKDGVAVQKQILDAAGNVLKSVGGSLSHAWGSIRHWHL